MTQFELKLREAIINRLADDVERATKRLNSLQLLFDAGHAREEEIVQARADLVIACDAVVKERKRQNESVG